MTTISITKDNMEKTIEEHDIVLIDFWAEWCGPCKTFGPVFEKAADKYPDITFGKCNTEEEQELSQALQIRSIPMLMVFKEGVLIFAQPGALPEPALNDLIDKIVDVDMEEVRKKMEEEAAKEAN